MKFIILLLISFNAMGQGSNMARGMDSLGNVRDFKIPSKTIITLEDWDAWTKECYNDSSKTIAMSPNPSYARWKRVHKDPNNLTEFMEFVRKRSK